MGALSLLLIAVAKAAPAYMDASQTLNAANVGDSFGASVSGAGDVDGDGYADVVVGAPGADGGAGSASVFSGSIVGIAAVPTLVLTAPAGTAAFGGTVAGVGDVNDDGYPDVVVAASAVDGGEGQVYEYLGHPGGVEVDAALILDGEAAPGEFGVTLTGVGDVDGDGFPDVAVGDPLFDNLKGRAYVYRGGPEGLRTDGRWILSGESADQGFGDGLAGGGDYNGDGVDDLAVGATVDAMAAVTYVYYGGVGVANTSADATLPGAWGPVNARDVNGDGYDDLATAGYRPSVYAGGTTGLDAEPTWSFDDAARIGSLGAAGDVDGDGYADLLAGVVVESAGPGCVREDLYLGTPVGPAPLAEASLWGGRGAGDFGVSTAPVGDAGGSALVSFVVGAPDLDGGGQVYVYPGPTEADADGDGSPASQDCDDADPANRPFSDEYCDGKDNDCDGQVDEGLGTVAYEDWDGDGFGDASTVCCACDEAHSASVGGDCDDDDASVYPGAVEVCNGVDDDCNGVVDDGITAAEVCDGVDNDCDGQVDEGFATVWYADADGDGHGDPSTAVLGCEPGPGWVQAGDDCNDADAAIHPGAHDWCFDGVDANCAGPDPRCAKLQQTGCGGGCASGTGEWPTLALAGLAALVLATRRR